MNFKESNVSGTSWSRCKNLSISNPLVEVPEHSIIRQIMFEQEEVISLENRDNLRTYKTSISKRYVPDSTITLLNPETGSPTGATMTHKELYAILYSLYVQTAQENDASLT